jgi:hypothetical protein
VHFDEDRAWPLRNAKDDDENKDAELFSRITPVKHQPK